MQSDLIEKAGELLYRTLRLLPKLAGSEYSPDALRLYQDTQDFLLEADIVPREPVDGQATEGSGV